MKKLMMRKLIILVFLICNTAFAGQATPLTDDPALEVRLKAMSQELRCLVCQNSTLADSDAPLAEDLRKEIRGQMRAGKSDEQIVDYLVTRYGDFVRFRPPVNSNTALLWFGPFIFLLIGAFMLYRALKKQAAGGNIKADEIKEEDA